MRVAVIGAAGQLGQALCRALPPHDVFAPAHADLDVTGASRVAAYLNGVRPDWVVNASAFHDVPRCEADAQIAFRVNTLGPRHLGRACREAGARLVHISTDYVFDGRKGAPYDEDDEPSPVNMYGVTKLMGERQALLSGADACVVRTTGLFGPTPCRGKPGGANFVDTMLRLARTRDELTVVGDQRCCPTYVGDLALQLRRMMEAQAPPGTYHAVNGPGCSWYEFACLIFEAAGVHVRVREVTSADYPSPVRRPDDSRLSGAALQRHGLLDMRPLADALADYLRERPSSAS
jgi:dTDP-4-dehydrorhamnose reductase